MNSDVSAGKPDSPSAWSKRLVLIALAVVGLGLSLYLTLYQLGIIAKVWEPFFGEGSETVLHSAISRLLPVPDASIGALGYLVEVILVSIGGNSRWHRQPWVVISYGLVIAGLGCVSIVLVIFQGGYLHTWCTLCLASAAISIAVAAVGANEVSASVQYLRESS